MPAARLLASGRQMLADGQLPAAVAMLREYMRLKPGDPDGPFWLGLALEQSGESAQALTAYNRALELAGKTGMDSGELRVNLANTLAKLNRLDDAIANYRRALVIDSKMARAHFNLGRALLARGDGQGALDSLNRSYELGLIDPALPYFRGLAFRALGKPEDAKAQLENYLKSLPETAAVENLKSKIRAMLEEASPPVSAP